MTRASFSIGIDLGTTNCALACVPLDGDAESEVLAIPQWHTPALRADAAMLPSFLYLPEEPLAKQLRGTMVGESHWVVGTFARARAAETPGRVAHSAKSWLCHPAADRTAPFLPWASEELTAEKKLSPVRASALMLAALRDAWNERFADCGADFAFDSQVITVTVPASFDAAAQRLTLAAAEEAGFPESVRLVEEPRAAFYRWLEQYDSAECLLSGLCEQQTRGGHILIVDVGGGTSDFSLFEFRPNGARHAPSIEPIAVSDHILLGGDNVDLAIAQRLESRLVDEGEELSGRQWAYLLARCRDVKEKALACEGPPGETFVVSIPARGSELVAGARSAHLERAEIEELLLEGFFPQCEADEIPVRVKAALGEWGLPYATDPAVTRHLADFLQGRPPVDAVLFNGGSLHPRPLRERIRRELAKWQRRAPPIVLENPEPGFAVARGAARLGKIAHSRAERLWMHTARAEFVEMNGMHESAEDRANGDRAVFHQRVRERAYTLWEMEGRPDGRQLEHWTQAEVELYAVPTAVD